MKTLLVCLMGFVLVIFGLSFVPSVAFSQQAAVQSQPDDTTDFLPMTSGECPSGKWDQTLGKCKEPLKKINNDASKEVLEMTNGECPPGKWDQTLGKCKEPLNKINDNADKEVLEMTNGECPPGKWDQTLGRCKEPLKPLKGDTSSAE